MRPSRCPTERQSGPQSELPLPAQPVRASAASTVISLMPWLTATRGGNSAMKGARKRFMRILCVLLIAFSATALAQNTPREELGSLLGLGVRSLPEYDGSSKQELELI